MATHRRRRKTVSSSGRVFSQENQRATWKKKKRKKILGGLRWKEDREREREKERSDKTATESAIRCTLHSDKVFSKRYDERETGDLYGENLYKSK